MSEPTKPTESAAKATDDFVTKYKVRLTLGDADSLRNRRAGNFVDFVVELFGPFRAIAVV